MRWEGNVINQWGWEGVGNETWLNLGVGMWVGLNHWDW